MTWTLNDEKLVIQRSEKRISSWNKLKYKGQEIKTSLAYSGYERKVVQRDDSEWEGEGKRWGQRVWQIMWAPQVWVSSVQSFSPVQLFAPSGTTAHDASLSITNFRSLLKLMSIESVMPSNHSHPLLSPSPPALNLSQHQGLFKWVSSLYEVTKVLELQLQHQSFQWIFRTDLLRMDWLDLLAVQGTLKSLLQHHSSKASILRHSAFFTVQLSHPYMTTGKTIAWTRWTFVGKVTSLLFNMLSRLVITFLPKSMRLLISWL